MIVSEMMAHRQSGLQIQQPYGLFGAIGPDQLTQVGDHPICSPQFTPGRCAHGRRRGQNEVRSVNTRRLGHIRQPLKLVKDCFRPGHLILRFKIIRPQRNDNGIEGRIFVERGSKTHLAVEERLVPPGRSSIAARVEDYSATPHPFGQSVGPARRPTRPVARAVGVAEDQNPQHRLLQRSPLTPGPWQLTPHLKLKPPPSIDQWQSGGLSLACPACRYPCRRPVRRSQPPP